MHASSAITEQKKSLAAVSGAALSLVTLGSLSLCGTSGNYFLTLSVLAIIILFTVVVLWRLKH